MTFDSLGALEEVVCQQKSGQTIDGTQPHFALAAWAMRNHEKPRNLYLNPPVVRLNIVFYHGLPYMFCTFYHVFGGIWRV
jgi:hypothetical protein